MIKITNEREALVGYNHFISNKGEWNNCFSKFSNLLAHSWSFLASQKVRNAIVRAENLIIFIYLLFVFVLF